MHLDPLTLMVPGVIATAFAGLLLFGAWWEYRNTPALLWWSASKGINATGVALVAGSFALELPFMQVVGVGLASATAPLIWGGVRHFYKLGIPWMLIAAGPAVWLALVLLPFESLDPRLATIAGFSSWCAYLSATIWTLWTNRGERLVARWPLIGFLALHALVFASAIGEVLTGSLPPNAPPPVNSWFGIIHFETILFSMGTALFMILMCKERRELGFIEAARIDPLTGTANRGAFFDNAHRVLDRCRRDRTPFSLVMFDLDRFKSINDTYGHQVGDRILRNFAETARLSLRPNDLFGRYGGEEFAVILPGASIETAMVIADRVRQLFAERHEIVDGKPVRTTVSAGVATAGATARLEDVIDAADKAMYAAKHSGRNRVERAPRNEPYEGSAVVRIA